MHFNNPWGLLALLSVPVILAVHLFRQRFPELPVAGSHLWASLTEVRQAGRRLDRLPLSKSLFFELLTALAVTAILCRPQFQPAEKALHLIVVLDDSASMSTQPQGRPSFVASAIETIEERSQRADAKVVLTILLTGTRPVMLAGPSVSLGEAADSLRKWRPTAIRHDVGPALELARQLASENGEVLFITDTQPDAADVVNYQSVGRSTDNVGFTASRLNSATATAPATVFLRVRNFSDAVTNATVTIFRVDAVSPNGDADVEANNTGKSDSVVRRQQIEQQTVRIEARSAVSVETVVPGDCTDLIAELSAGQDALAIDNVVELLAEPEREVRIGFDLPDSDFRRNAVARAVNAINFVSVSSIEDAHIVFGTSKTILTGSEQWLVSIADETRPGAPGTTDVSGPYIADRRNPMVTGVTLDGVIIAGVGDGGDVADGLSPLISTGDRILFGRRTQANGQPAWHLNLDLNRSTLVDSPDWPILLSNIAEQRRAILPGLPRSHYRSGEHVQFRNPIQSTDDTAAGFVLSRRSSGITMADDSETTEVPIAATRQIDIGSHLLKTPGVYQIHQDQTLVAEFAVNFHDAAESDLQPLTPGEFMAPVASSKLDVIDSPLTWVAILAIGCALLAVVANWRELKL